MIIIIIIVIIIMIIIIIAATVSETLGMILKSVEESWKTWTSITEDTITKISKINEQSAGVIRCSFTRSLVIATSPY